MLDSKVVSGDKHLIVGSGVTNFPAFTNQAVAGCQETRFLGINFATDYLLCCIAVGLVSASEGLVCRGPWRTDERSVAFPNLSWRFASRGSDLFSSGVNDGRRMRCSTFRLGIVPQDQLTSFVGATPTNTDQSQMEIEGLAHHP